MIHDHLKFCPSSWEPLEHKYQRLHLLPKNRDTYGLIHMDLHPWNFFYHNREIIPFDFDDCVYSWFVADLAMALYYVTQEEADVDGHKKKEWWPGSLSLSRGALVKTFLEPFLSGYQPENALDSAWLRRIPEFLRLRLLDLYVGKCMAWGTTDLSEPQRQNLKRHREAIEDDAWIDTGLDALY